MTKLIIDIKSIVYNLFTLQEKLLSKNIETILIVKILNGNRDVLKHLLPTPNLFAIGDSRISTLKWIKSKSKQSTILIKPPAKDELLDVIKYCDYSHACNLDMLRLLNRYARLHGKKHKVFLMVEMGDCREGFYRTNLKKRVNQIRRLKHIEIVGIGANFGCLDGKHPALTDLTKLCAIKSKLETQLGYKLLLSAGASNSLLLFDQFPSVDIVRLGEAVFLGNADVKQPLPYLQQGTFKLQTDILQHRNREYLLDFGELDTHCKYLTSPYKFVGCSSDMSVIRTSENLGSTVEFDCNHYKAVRGLMLSPFIRKELLL